VTPGQAQDQPEGRRRLKLAIVVQRYGADISGGAELHARYIAERLAAHADVQVLTTCARDYDTWRNEFPAGATEVNGIPVERFTVTDERDLRKFDRRSAHVFGKLHSLQDELEWLDSQGPVSRGLLARLESTGRELDFVLLFSARYHHAYWGARALPERAVLVPTMERDPALGLAVLRPIFRGVRGIMYNSFEERALIQAASGNEQVPGVVVGVGSEIPADVAPARARQTFGLHDPFIIYVGRIDANKGCAQLFDFFIDYVERRHAPLDLVLIGTPKLPIPAHPRIRHLGYVSDQDKFDAIAAADALVMPSRYESLSMVALEAWALGRPVLANGRCDVLVGQCIRSNAGLYYGDVREFAGALDALVGDPTLATTLGRHGRTYYDRYYNWSVIVRQYLDMFERLAAEPRRAAMEPLPGWWERRRRVLPPGAEVVDALPSGPILVGAHA
jgi:glycosyltransferase involved in cell wall biosynthesis